MSWTITKTKKDSTWVVGVAWIDGTLYIGLFIYLSLHFKKM